MDIPSFATNGNLSIEILPGTKIDDVVNWAVNFINRNKGSIKYIDFDFNSVHIVVDENSTIEGISRYYFYNLGKEEIKWAKVQYVYL